METCMYTPTLYLELNLGRGRRGVKTSNEATRRHQTSTTTLGYRVESKVVMYVEQGPTSSCREIGAS